MKFRPVGVELFNADRQTWQFFFFLIVMYVPSSVFCVLFVCTVLLSLGVNQMCTVLLSLGVNQMCTVLLSLGVNPIAV
jgi:hypothetical protein